MSALVDKCGGSQESVCTAVTSTHQLAQVRQLAGECVTPRLHPRTDSHKRESLDFRPAQYFTFAQRRP